MLTAYADSIERAQAGVTEDVVQRAVDIFVGGNQYTSEHQCNRMRAALVAVWPSVPSLAAQADVELYKSACDGVEEWKARALKAERIAERLGDSLNDMTGPTFMGEPVLSRPVTQGEAVQLEAAIKRAARKSHG